MSNGGISQAAGCPLAPVTIILVYCVLFVSTEVGHSSLMIVRLLHYSSFEVRNAKRNSVGVVSLRCVADAEGRACREVKSVEEVEKKYGAQRGIDQTG